MTAASTDASPLALETFDEISIAALRTVLLEAGFDDAFLGECEAIAPRLFDAVRLPVVQWSLQHDPRPAAVIARLWAYGDEVDDADLERVLIAPLRDRLEDVGLLRRTASGWRGAMRLVPFGGLWIASDDMHDVDPVMGPGATTEELARAIPPGAGRVLDVGCGAGSLALIAAARGASEVVGVDLHPRAAQWSRINARLNDLEMTAHTGDLCEPVQGERFDLVIAQPPFVVKPEAVQATTYLHGGAMGDELTMRLISELPGVLAPDGEARILFDSPVRPDASLAKRLQQAHGDEQMQQLLFVTPGNPPDVQAIGYAASSHPALGETYAADVLRYREHLHQRGIEQCEHALVVLRRPAEGAGLTVTVRQRSLDTIDADAIAGTWLAVEIASAPAEVLLRATVSLPEGAWLVQEQATDDGEIQFKLRLPEARGGEELLSDAAAMLIDMVREPGTVDAIIKRYAVAASAKPAEVQEPVLDFVRQSLVSGRLVARSL